MKYIYENDCPADEEAKYYGIFGSFYWKPITTYRFKPDGITDNRNEYYQKRQERLWGRMYWETIMFSLAGFASDISSN